MPNREPMTQDQWRDFAARLKTSLHTMNRLYSDAIQTAPINDADGIRRAVRAAWKSRSESRDIAAKQHGYDFADRLFFGGNWETPL